MHKSTNQSKTAKRLRNKAKNETLRAAGRHPKQIRAAANLRRHLVNLASGKTTACKCDYTADFSALARAVR